MLNLQMEQRSINMLQMVITSSIYVNFWYISYIDFWGEKNEMWKDDRWSTQNDEMYIYLICDFSARYGRLD